VKVWYFKWSNQVCKLHTVNQNRTNRNSHDTRYISRQSEGERKK